MKVLSHVCFVVSDLEKSVSFYRDKLGFPVAFELTIMDGAVRGVFFHAGGRTFIELFEGQPVPTPPDASYKHICLEVDNMEEFVKTLRERGVEVGEITLGTDQSYQAWLADPDGNRIELQEFTDESLQVKALERFGI